MGKPIVLVQWKKWLLVIKGTTIGGGPIFISMIIGERVVTSRACHLWNHFCNAAFLFCDFWVLDLTHRIWHYFGFLQKMCMNLLLFAMIFWTRFICGRVLCFLVYSTCISNSKSFNAWQVAKAIRRYQEYMTKFPPAIPMVFPLEKFNAKTQSRGTHQTESSQEFHHVSITCRFVRSLIWPGYQKNETHDGVAPLRSSNIKRTFSSISMLCFWCLASESNSSGDAMRFTKPRVPVAWVFFRNLRPGCGSDLHGLLLCWQWEKCHSKSLLQIL